MAKRYNETISVYKPESQPPFFVWRGKRYDVMRILNYWVEAGEWWTPQQKDWEIFKVIAKPQRETSPGVYQLRYDKIGQSWRLVTVMD